MHSSQLTKRGILYYILTTWYFYNNSHTRLGCSDKLKNSEQSLHVFRILHIKMHSKAV